MDAELSGTLPVDQRTARTEDRGQKVKPYQPAGYWQHLNFPPASGKPDKETISTAEALHIRMPQLPPPRHGRL